MEIRMRLLNRVAALSFATLFALSTIACGDDATTNETGEPTTETGDDAGTTAEGDATSNEEESDAGPSGEEQQDTSGTETAPGTILEVAAAAGDFGLLATAIESAGLTDTLNGEGPFTVFAPTDAAVTAALEALGLTADEFLADAETLTSILTYHVVSGEVLAETVVTLDSATTLQGSDITIEVVEGGVVLNGTVNVTATDVMASNGVIHVIDAVLLPPAEEEPAEPGTILEVAGAAGDFGLLAAAVQAAGLADTLNGEGPFTVFAPTDAAVTAALEALNLTAEEFLADTALLTSVLTYHVVSGKVLAADVVNLESATTLEGSDITIEVVEGGVVLNGTVNVTATDVMASNGVIHVIDAVLLPPSS